MNALKVLLVVFIFTANNTSIAKETAKPSLEFSQTKIAKGMVVLSGKNGTFTGGNILVSIGDDGVVVIDNGISQVRTLLRTELEKLTDKPVDYLINTHVHGDHTGNNEDFGAKDTKIISHQNLRMTLVDKGVNTPEGVKAASKDSLPVITFTQEMTLHLNNDAVHIIHVENAHTDGDAAIFFKNSNVLHAGDVLFNQRFPYIDYSNGGSIKGVIAALEKLYSIGDENTKIVPGHGPMATKDDITATLAMINDSVSLIDNLLKQGKSEAEILEANPLKKYEHYSWGFITTEKMTKQVIAGLKLSKQY